MTTTIDEALDLLAGSGPEFTFGRFRLSNHGPMAAEALLALGRSDTMIPWVERYRTRLEDRPQARNPISRDQWREALGELGRVGDWTAFFDRELADAPWREVLDTWVQRLAPGIVASATHGVIRTAHAVRSLDVETPQRRHELAEGLAYWAATYMTLPGSPSGSSGGLAPSQAIREVGAFPREQQQDFGTITGRLTNLDALPSFAGAIDLVDASGDASAFLSDLTETFAGVYLANAPHNGQVIGLIHAVTGPSAVRLLAPHLARETTELALRYAWQAAAALFVTMAQQPAPASIAEPAGDHEDIIDRAVATGDEHAIKFTEACLREYALNPKPVYLTAALDASQRLSRG